MGGKGSKVKLQPGDVRLLQHGDVITSLKATEMWEAYSSAAAGGMDEATARRFLHDFRRKMKLSKEYEAQFDDLIEHCSVRGPDGRLFDLDAFKALLRSLAADAPVELSNSLATGGIPIPIEEEPMDEEDLPRPPVMCAMRRPESPPLPGVASKASPPRRCSMRRPESPPRLPISVPAPRPVMCAMRPIEPPAPPMPAPPPVMCAMRPIEPPAPPMPAPPPVMCAMRPPSLEHLQRPPEPFSDAIDRIGAPPTVKKPSLERQSSRKQPRIMCAMRRPMPQRKCGMRRRPTKVPKELRPLPDNLEVLRSSVEAPKPLNFSVDLIRACETLLNCIAEFGAMKELHTSECLERALVRYELFLALYCSVAEKDGEEAAKQLVPPVDVAHVWRAHLIRPVMYRADCRELFGRQISPAVLFTEIFTRKEGNEAEQQKESRQQAEDVSKMKWEEMIEEEEIPHMAYYPEAGIEGDLPCSEVSIGLHHLTEDLSWWTNFEEFWGKEYESDRLLFLEKRQESYKDFLQLGAARVLKKSVAPDAKVDFKGPPIDVDLFWHCHMMFPDVYDQDLHSQLGCLFYHQPAADPESKDSTWSS